MTEKKKSNRNTRKERFIDKDLLGGFIIDAVTSQRNQSGFAGHGYYGDPKAELRDSDIIRFLSDSKDRFIGSHPFGGRSWYFGLDYEDRLRIENYLLRRGYKI